MRARLFAITFALTVSTAARAPAASAREGAKAKSQDPLIAKVRALYDSGTTHYNLAEYKEALADFKEAYRLKSDPAFLFNLGQCHRQLGKPEQAAQMYRAYLRAAPDAPNRKDVEQFIADADAAIAVKAKQAARPLTATQSPQLEAVPQTAMAATPATPPPTEKRIKPWVWAVASVGAALVIGGAVGLGVGLSQSNSPPTDATLGGSGVTWQ
jgi:tetratricopeptide (TPR) repeat protein